MKIYEITGEFKQLMDMAEEMDLDQKTINDTLEGIEFELEIKADNYAKIIQMLDGDISMIDNEIKRLEAKKKTLVNNKKSLVYNLTNAMLLMNKKKFKTVLFGFSIQKNAPSIEIVDQDKIPDEFWKKPDPVLDKKSLLTSVKLDPQKYESCAVLKQTESLRIR